MAATGEIDIFGKLVAQTTRGVIAGAEQIEDTTQNKMQSTINSEVAANIKKAIKIAKAAL